MLFRLIMLLSFSSISLAETLVHDPHIASHVSEVERGKYYSAYVLAQDVLSGSEELVPDPLYEQKIAAVKQIATYLDQNKERLYIAPTDYEYFFMFSNSLMAKKLGSDWDNIGARIFLHTLKDASESELLKELTGPGTDALLDYLRFQIEYFMSLNSKSNDDNRVEFIHFIARANNVPYQTVVTHLRRFNIDISASPIRVAWVRCLSFLMF